MTTNPPWNISRFAAPASGATAQLAGVGPPPGAQYSEGSNAALLPASGVRGNAQSHVSFVLQQPLIVERSVERSSPRDAALGASRDAPVARLVRGRCVLRSFMELWGTRASSGSHP